MAATVGVELPSVSATDMDDGSFIANYYIVVSEKRGWGGGDVIRVSAVMDLVNLG